MRTNVNNDQIISFIEQYTAEHQYPPTFREIGAAVGLRSSATVHARMQTLLRQGRIFYVPNHQGSLRTVK